MYLTLCIDYGGWYSTFCLDFGAYLRASSLDLFGTGSHVCGMIIVEYEKHDWRLAEPSTLANAGSKGEGEWISERIGEGE